MKVTILGSGVYAKAISNVLLHDGNDVTMWTEKADLKKVLAREGTRLTNSFEEAVHETEVVFVLTGSQFVRSVLEGIAPFVREDVLVVLGSKGLLEDGTLMTDLAQEILPNNAYAVISGPTFAVDIAALEPVGFTIGTTSADDFHRLEKCLISPTLEHSKDTLAIEMCGSLKNAYAIGSGILSGFNFGPSTTCLYISKVLNEMGHIFEAMGASASSTTTLAGVGDLVLTCTSPNSRNYTFGTILALGSPDQSREYLRANTVEGYENLRAYVALFERKKIDAPIMNCVYDIVEGKSSSQNLIKLLLKKQV